MATTKPVQVSIQVQPIRVAYQTLPPEASKPSALRRPFRVSIQVGAQAGLSSEPKRPR